MKRSSETPPSVFRRFAHSVSHAVGMPSAFVLACLVIVVWAATGPFFNYSDTWQLAINTGTTIVTFLMCFVIQNTQNRDAKAVHLKLDELISSVAGARNRLVDLEDLSDEELADLQDQFRKLRRRANQNKEDDLRAIHGDIDDDILRDTGSLNSG